MDNFVSRPRRRIERKLRAAYVGYDPDADETNMTADEVIVEEDDGWTGLYDASGRPIYRIRPRVGFLR